MPLRALRLSQQVVAGFTTAYGQAQIVRSLHPGRAAGDRKLALQYRSVKASAALWIRLAAVEAEDPRLSIAELLGIFAAGWETATLVIPLVLVEDPVAVPLAGPPVAELYVRAAREVRRRTAAGRA